MLYRVDLSEDPRKLTVFFSVALLPNRDLSFAYRQNNILFAEDELVYFPIRPEYGKTPHFTHVRGKDQTVFLTGCQILTIAACVPVRKTAEIINLILMGT